MPLCPRCHDEYQATVATCPDCEVPLVESLDPSAPPEHLQPLPIVVEEGSLRDEVADCLEQASVPFREVDRGFEVPAGLFVAIVRGLNGLFDLDHPEGKTEVRVVGHCRVEEAPDDAILELSHEELVTRGDTAVAELRALIRWSGEPGRRAGLRLSRLHAASAIDLSHLLLDALASGDTREVFSYTAILRDLEQPDVAQQVAEVVGKLTDEGLKLALHVLGQLPDQSVAPQVIPLLEHESAEVRAEADDVLCLVSGTDMGFDAESPESTRTEAVVRWREWFDEA